jgi:N-acetylmuramoyl-L-alanine amidase
LFFYILNGHIYRGLNERRAAKSGSVPYFSTLIVMVILVMTVLILSACFSSDSGTTPVATVPVPEQTTSEPTAVDTQAPSTQPTAKPTPTKTPALSPSPTAKPTAGPTAKPTARPTIKPAPSAAATLPENPPALPDSLDGYIVVLDPGHQAHANYELEPISPGSDATKIKTSSGTQGVYTHRPEYEVNLEISLKMQKLLQDLGCTVYMTRTENDVTLSNIERATFAVSCHPSVFLRIHCDGSNDPLRRGVGIFVANSGAYTDMLPDWGKNLTDSICAQTGARPKPVNASSRYTGLNWAAEIPSFLLEMGYMTNPVEDRLLSDPDYQDRICRGVAVFIAQMPKTAG